MSVKRKGMKEVLIVGHSEYMSFSTYKLNTLRDYLIEKGPKAKESMKKSLAKLEKKIDSVYDELLEKELIDLDKFKDNK